MHPMQGALERLGTRPLPVVPLLDETLRTET
jgi:hypothetical protein